MTKRKKNSTKVADQLVLSLVDIFTHPDASAREREFSTLLLGAYLSDRNPELGIDVTRLNDRAHILDLTAKMEAMARARS